MNQTDVWMLGVAAFGIVFYLFSMYFHKTGDYPHHQGQHHDGGEDHE